MNYTIDKLKEAILFNAAEVIPGNNEDLAKELSKLVKIANASGEPIKHYIGFEISGLIHIGTGMSSALKIKKLTDAGVRCYIWLADYHTFLNNKLDGKLETIRFVAREYFGPVMLECMKAAGCDMTMVEVLYAEDEYKKLRKDISFWEYDLACGKELTLSRVLKSLSIMGKEAGNSIDFGTLRYPVMQVTDAFFLGTQLVQAGMDQRKCHVLMREVAHSIPEHYALTIANQRVKPIAIHHALLLSLEAPKEGEDEAGAKMSKSKPNSAIWVHDDQTEITAKLRKAYCPMPESLSDEQLNRIPLLQWSKCLIYPAGKSVSLERTAEHGGNAHFGTYVELFEAYKSNQIHPLDLKSGVAKTLADWFRPMREYVAQNPQGADKIKLIKG